MGVRKYDERDCSEVLPEIWRESDGLLHLDTRRTHTFPVKQTLADVWFSPEVSTKLRNRTLRWFSLVNCNVATLMFFPGCLKLVPVQLFVAMSYFQFVSVSWFIMTDFHLEVVKVLLKQFDFWFGAVNGLLGTISVMFLFEWDLRSAAVAAEFLSMIPYLLADAAIEPSARKSFLSTHFLSIAGYLTYAILIARGQFPDMIDYDVEVLGLQWNLRSFAAARFGTYALWAAKFAGTTLLHGPAAMCFARSPMFISLVPDDAKKRNHRDHHRHDSDHHHHHHRDAAPRSQPREGDSGSESESSWTSSEDVSSSDRGSDSLEEHV
eukprot:GFYU01003102.1.p1 GENE.GFYU01003102.1~~GFYU01003102.1.p1  ORF type:complete len:322 (+),score=33.20 GFYU01003102.1:297-1262(+)